MMLTCIWVTTQTGDVCGIPTLKGKEYCYKHYPMWCAGVPDIKIEKPAKETMSFDFSAAVEREYQEYLRGERAREERSGKSKRKKKKRFPGYADGIFFLSQREYDLFHGHEDVSTSYEMPGTDQEYLDTPAGIQSWIPKAAPPPPAHIIPVSSYEVVGHVAHMWFYVARNQDGGYHAVWVSCRDKAAVDPIMCEALKAGEQLLPVEVGSMGRFHSSAAYLTFGGAKSRFMAGGESMERMRERMLKASDPQWLPPNVRHLAAMERWERLAESNTPEPVVAAARAWHAAGMKGWWGPTKHGRSSSSNDKKSSSTQHSLVKRNHDVLPARRVAVVSRNYFPGAKWNHIRNLWESFE